MKKIITINNDITINKGSFHHIDTVMLNGSDVYICVGTTDKKIYRIPPSSVVGIINIKERRIYGKDRKKF